MSQKNIAILIGTLAIAAIVIFGVTYIALELIPDSPQINQTATTTDGIAPPSPNTPNDNTRIFKTAPKDPRAVIYTTSGFSRSEVTMHITDTIGCLVTIENKTTSPLRVGVGPHNASGDPGANYGEILPGELGILDPRYPGLDDVSLHDHDRPSNEFRVIYGTGCK